MVPPDKWDTAVDLISNTTGPNIHRWSRSQNREPVVRIGVVLDEDRADALHLTLSTNSHRLIADGGHELPLGRSAIEFGHAAEGVVVRADDGRPHTSSCWRLVPAGRQPVEKGGGITVRDVIAGRGFHWQKRVDQTFVGSLEIAPSSGGLVVVNEVGLEAYLAGVITSEASGSCPTAFLEAQCVVARSWMLALFEDKHPGQPFDRCNDDCCQRYHGTNDLSDAAVRAVTTTRGRVLVDGDGNMVDANYSKCCGGVSEDPVFVWGETKSGISVVVDAPVDSAARRFLPVTDLARTEYLTGSWISDTDVYCSPNAVSAEDLSRYLGRVDDVGQYFRWTHGVDRAELESRFRSRLDGAEQLTRLTGLVPTRRGVSGRVCAMDVRFEEDGGGVRTVRVEGELLIRGLLSDKVLYSSAFDVAADAGTDQLPKSFELRGAGWGHGVGFCQMGGLGMALAGLSSGEILKHYFPQADSQCVYGGSGESDR